MDVGPQAQGLGFWGANNHSVMHRSSVILIEDPDAIEGIIGALWLASMQLTASDSDSGFRKHDLDTASSLQRPY